MDDIEIVDSSTEEDVEGVSQINNHKDSAHVLLHQPSPPLNVLLIVMLLYLWQSAFKISNIAIEVLLKFLNKLLTNTSILSIKPSVQLFPNSYLTGRKLPHIIYPDDFETFICCPKCSTLYQNLKCNSNKSCSHIKFLLHPQL